jgi:hypothetical protein
MRVCVFVRARVPVEREGGRKIVREEDGDGNGRAGGWMDGWMDGWMLADGSGVRARARARARESPLRLTSW